jgi:hypothetical protein
MTETIVPGTYIDVRAEGLISAGRVATGIIGIVGTAAAGPVGEPVTLALPSEGRARFGAADDPRNPEDGVNPLTLVRAVDLAYGNGASTVLAVRVAGPNAAAAQLALRDDDDRTAATLTAASPGTWGNDIRVRVQPADQDAFVQREQVPVPFDGVRHTPIVPSPRTRVRVTRGATGRSQGFEVVYRRLQRDERVVPTSAGRFFLSARPVEPGIPATRVVVTDAEGGEVVYTGDAIDFGAGGAPDEGRIRILTDKGEIIFAAGETPGAGDEAVATYAVGHPPPTPGQVRFTAWIGRLDFADGEAPSQGDGDALEVTYLVSRSSATGLTLSVGGTTERFVGPSAAFLSHEVNRRSALVTAEADEIRGGALPVLLDATMGSGSNQRGANGADATADDYRTGLDALADDLVNIVVLAGQDAVTAGNTLAQHLAATAEDEHERMGVIGAAGTTVDDLTAHGLADDRIVVVAPGLRYPDGLQLPAGFTAAAVAGLMASVDVQTSLTNKPLNVPGLDRTFNRGEQGQLIRGDVLAVVRKDGHRVLRGITTAGEGMPFSSIPIRRIVDFAKYGVRSAANPYIGRLNNQRVRDALRSTLDGFLTRMVDAEALTGFELEVYATRAQEIAGEVSVVMTLQPTFSIEFIQVTMFLR